MQKFAVFFTMLFLTLAGYAKEFQSTPSLPEKITCTEKKGKLIISGRKQSYQFYEKNQKTEKIHGCEKITLGGTQFYSVTFTAALNTPIGPKKILAYEILLDNKKSLETLRSEVIDEVDLKADLPSKDFTKSFKSQWGISAKDKKAMVQLTIDEKNEKPFTYLLKLNDKKSWFENVF